MKLSEDPNVPVLEGWVNLTEAAEMLGITRQHSYKKATQFGKTGGWRSLHRVGSQPAYVVSVQEIQDIIAAREEKARQRSAQAEEETSQ